MTSTDLVGRTAIVTGASRGIGAAIARALARRGAAVAVGARTEQVWNDDLPGTVYETAEQIRAEGGTCLAVRCDVTSEDDLVHLVERARAELGPIDIVVNNAAATAPGGPGRTPPTVPPAAVVLPAAVVPPATEVAAGTAGTFAVAATHRLPGLSMGSLRKQVEVSLFAAFRLTELVLPDMLASGRGAIVMISSEAARQPGAGPYFRARVPLPMAYGVGKAAMEHLTRNVAYALSGSGIAVNALVPSLAVPTPAMLLMGDEFLKETVSIESVAEAAVRLAMADSSSTGQVLFSEDVLHPELGRRGWLGSTP